MDDVDADQVRVAGDGEFESPGLLISGDGKIAPRVPGVVFSTPFADQASIINRQLISQVVVPIRVNKNVSRSEPVWVASNRRPVRAAVPAAESAAVVRVPGDHEADVEVLQARVRMERGAVPRAARLPNTEQTCYYYTRR